MTAKDALAQLLVFFGRFNHIEDVRGEPFIVEGRKLIPTSRNIHIGGAGAGGGGGFIWNRPIAITEEIGEGIYRHYAIRDETLRALIGILASVVIFRLVMAILLKHR